MTKPLPQLRITQLMDRGAQTLIVPDTNTAASVLCMSIPCISASAEANRVTGMLGLLSELTDSRWRSTDSVLLAQPGVLPPCRKHPLLLMGSSRCRCGAARCLAGDGAPRGAAQRPQLCQLGKGPGMAREWPGNGARALWRPPWAGTGGMGARGWFGNSAALSPTS